MPKLVWPSSTDLNTYHYATKPNLSNQSSYPHSLTQLCQATSSLTNAWQNYNEYKTNHYVSSQTPLVWTSSEQRHYTTDSTSNQLTYASTDLLNVLGRISEIFTQVFTTHSLSSIQLVTRAFGSRLAGGLPRTHRLIQYTHNYLST